MIPILIIIGLLCTSAIFSASEMAIMGVPKYKIKKFINEHPSKNKVAKLLLHFRQDRSERTLITILIANNLINVVLSVYAGQLGDSLFSNIALSGAMILIIISLSITFLIVFFGEIIPKVFATKYALPFAIFVTPIIQTVTIVLFPIVWILEQVIHLLSRIVDKQDEGVSKADVEVFIEEGRKQGIFSDAESMIINNFLEFDGREVDSVLKHRTDVFALSEDETLESAIQRVVQTPYSRIPIYRNDKDQIVGLLTLRDAMRLYIDASNRSKQLKTFNLRTAARVPITANLFELFLDMKKQGWHFAVVIDEHGGTAGIVTFEDILEDLVGVIKDEADTGEEGDIINADAVTVRARGDVVLRAVIDALQLHSFVIPEEFTDDISEEDSLSYIIINSLKEFAKPGDIVHLGQIDLEVTKVNKVGEKIDRVEVSINN